MQIYHTPTDGAPKELLPAPLPLRDPWTSAARHGLQRCGPGRMAPQCRVCLLECIEPPASGSSKSNTASTVITRSRASRTPAPSSETINGNCW